MVSCSFFDLGEMAAKCERMGTRVNGKPLAFTLVELLVASRSSASDRLLLPAVPPAKQALAMHQQSEASRSGRTTTSRPTIASRSAWAGPGRARPIMPAAPRAGFRCCRSWKTRRYTMRSRREVAGLRGARHRRWMTARTLADSRRGTLRCLGSSAQAIRGPARPIRSRCRIRFLHGRFDHC